jgi:hypothetical protein
MSQVRNSLQNDSALIFYIFYIFTHTLTNILPQMLYPHIYERLTRFEFQKTVLTFHPIILCGLSLPENTFYLMINRKVATKLWYTCNHASRAETCCHLNITQRADRVSFREVFKGLQASH